jgi:hypothetical protein
MKTSIWIPLLMTGVIVFAVALAIPAHAARQVAGPPVLVKKANKALVASP